MVQSLKEGDNHAVGGQVQGTYAIIPIKTNLCRGKIRARNVTTLLQPVQHCVAKAPFHLNAQLYLTNNIIFKDNLKCRKLACKYYIQTQLEGNIYLQPNEWTTLICIPTWRIYVVDLMFLISIPVIYRSNPANSSIQTI